MLRELRSKKINDGGQIYFITKDAELKAQKNNPTRPFFGLSKENKTFINQKVTRFLKKGR
jgi:hypothetical protein